MVVLQNHKVAEIKRKNTFQTNLITEDGLTLAIQTEDLDIPENITGGDIQIAWGNYGDSHPVYLAIFYDDKRIYPKDKTQPRRSFDLS